MALIVVLAGCYSYKPVTDPDPQSEPVRVRFAQTTHVGLTGADSSYVADVRELEGIVTAVRTDSIRLVVSDGEDARGRAIAGGEIAMVPQSASPIIERRRMSASRSALAVFGGAAAIALLFVVIHAISN
jgi:hypothetical protein